MKMNKTAIIAPRSTFSHYLPAHMVSGGGAPVKVLLIGAGGNGGPMLTGLCRIDYALRALRHQGLAITVMDPDTVSPSNVGRQMFSPSDIHRNKAECLVTRLNMFFGTDMTALPWSFGEEHLEDVSKGSQSLIISAVDNVRARRLVHKAIKGKAIYHLDLGNTRNTGQAVLGTGSYIKQPKNMGECIGQLPGVLDLYPKMSEEEGKAYQGAACGLAESLELQDLLINTVLTSHALALLWEAFRVGRIASHGIFVSLESKKAAPLPISPLLWQQMGWSPHIQNIRKSAAGSSRKKAA